ncbi:AraC family transcriptional regulator [Actinophytocola sediminis]
MDVEQEFVSVPLVRDAVVSAVGYRTQGEPVLHRGLPSPALTVVFSLDDPIVTGLSPAHARSQDAYRNQIVLGGLHTSPAYIAQPVVQSGIQLAVRPLAARALFGLPAAELRLLTTEGADVLGESATRLRAQLTELATWPERFAALERYLRARQAASRPRPARAEVMAAWKWIAWHRGTGSMTGLAQHVLLSQRQLTTLFRAELGVSPKTASRLMRFENARQHLARAVRSGVAPDIASVAAACGYFDHSHLVRDFQQFVGTSPTGWLAEERQNIQAGAGQVGQEWES